MYKNNQINQSITSAFPMHYITPLLIFLGIYSSFPKLYLKGRLLCGKYADGLACSGQISAALVKIPQMTNKVAKSLKSIGSLSGA